MWNQKKVKSNLPKSDNDIVNGTHQTYCLSEKLLKSPIILLDALMKTTELYWTNECDWQNKSEWLELDWSMN